MKESKLVVLLSTFNVSEWRKFGEYLNSPYFNKKRELLFLYKILRGLAPEFEEQKLIKSAIFQKIYPNQKYETKILEDLIYQLLKQAENFLVVLKIEQKPAISNLLISEALIDRKLEKHYRIYQKQAKKILANKEIMHSDYLLFQYLFSDLGKKKFEALKQRKYHPVFQESLEHLDLFYFYNKLKASCEILANKDVIAKSFEIAFIEELVLYLSENQTILPPIIKIYLVAYHVLSPIATEEHYIQLTKLLQKNDSKITKEDKNTLYLFAINYCVLQMKRNNRVYFYVEECLRLYLYGIQEKFLYQNDYLSPWTFKNVVKLGFNLKRYIWTEDFIHTYYKHLELAFQNDAFHYNMADLNYRKQDYDNALSHLMEVKYSDIFYNLDAKTMLIKIYYETKEEEALLSMIASFTIYLKRDSQISLNFRQAYLNFTKLLYQFLKAKPPKVLGILEKIKTTEPLTDRRWLINICHTQQEKAK